MHPIHRGWFTVVSLATLAPIFADEKPSLSAIATGDRPDFVTRVDGAVNPQALPWEKVMWTFFWHVKNLELRKTGAGGAFLTGAVKLDESAATALMRYIDTALSHHLQFQRTQKNSMCSGSLATESAASIGAALAAQERSESQQVVAHVNDLATVLDAASLAKLNQWIETHFRSGVSMVNIDYQKLLADPSAKAAFAKRLQSACAEQPSAQR
jgi:hypothetical protein